MARLDDAYGSKIKIGLDIHGVIDQAPQFFKMFSEMPEYFEVHIITGIKEKLDEDVTFPYESWFSIHEQCEKDGVEVVLDENGRPWVDPAIWDKMKAEYCEREGIHIMIDDSPVYGQYFKDLECMYLRLENTHRDNWRQDGHHKNSPVDEDDRTYSFTIPGKVVRLGRKVKAASIMTFQYLKRKLGAIPTQVRAFCLQPSKIYDYSEGVDLAVQHMLDNCTLTGLDSYEAHFKDQETSDTYTVWIANAMYGYGSRGSKNGSRTWDCEQPSRVTCMRLKHAVDAYKKMRRFV